MERDNKPIDTEITTPSERFLAARDVAFIAILLLHMGSGILALPSIVIHKATPDCVKYLAVVIILGVLVPLLVCFGIREHRLKGVAKISCAVWWELLWTFCVFIVDFVIALAYAARKTASKTMVGLTTTQAIITISYFLLLSIITYRHNRSFPNPPIWKCSVLSVSWLRSSTLSSPNGPFSKNVLVSRPSYRAKPKLVAPWDQEYHDQLEKIQEENEEFKGDRMRDAEENMVYIMGRYGFRPGSSVMKHGMKRGSRLNKLVGIADISKPLPVVPNPVKSRTQHQALPEHPRQVTATTTTTHQMIEPGRQTMPTRRPDYQIQRQQYQVQRPSEQQHKRQPSSFEQHKRQLSSTSSSGKTRKLMKESISNPIPIRSPAPVRSMSLDQRREPPPVRAPMLQRSMSTDQQQQQRRPSHYQTHSSSKTQPTLQIQIPPSFSEQQQQKPRPISRTPTTPRKAPPKLSPLPEDLDQLPTIIHQSPKSIYTTNSPLVVPGGNQNGSPQTPFEDLETLYKALRWSDASHFTTIR